jgi:hypothetical protein
LTNLINYINTFIASINGGYFGYSTAAAFSNFLFSSSPFENVSFTGLISGYEFTSFITLIG